MPMFYYVQLPMMSVYRYFSQWMTKPIQWSVCPEHAHLSLSSLIRVRRNHKSIVSILSAKHQGGLTCRWVKVHCVSWLNYKKAKHKNDATIRLTRAGIFSTSYGKGVCTGSLSTSFSAWIITDTDDYHRRKKHTITCLWYLYKHAFALCALRDIWR